MATEQQEDSEIESTEDKGRAIGEAMGVVEDEAPDFEIIEEDEPKADAKLAKSAKRENKQTPREKREAKKNLYRKHGFDEGYATAEQTYKPIIDSLVQKQAELDARFAGLSKTDIEKTYATAKQQFDAAERDHADAVTQGDGVRATAAVKAWQTASKKMEQMESAYNQLSVKPRREAAASTTEQEWSPRVVSAAEDWRKRNDWYDPKGKDTDSVVANAIAVALTNEGFNPQSEDYWDELNDRLEKKNIRVARDDEDDGYEEEEIEAKPRRRASPPVTGGSGARGDVRGKQHVKLDTAWVESMKMNAPDIWADKARRDRMIMNHLRMKKEDGRA